jgi:hypothetical protein
MTKNRHKTPAKDTFWKVRLTAVELTEFKQLATEFGMDPSKFFRALPKLFRDRISQMEHRMALARCLRYLECIHERVSETRGFPPELGGVMEQALSDLRSQFQLAKKKRRPSVRSNAP